MTFKGLVERMAAHSSKRANLDDIPLVLTKVNIAMERVCRNTIPLELVKDSSSSRRLLRRLDKALYIATPTPVVDDDLTQIEMDDFLIDAVALFALAGIETARAPSYMKMYWDIIASNEDNLIESDLSLEYVALQDFVNNTEQVIKDTEYSEDRENEWH